MVHKGLYPVCLNREAEPGFRHTDQVSFAFRLTLGLHQALCGAYSAINPSVHVSPSPEVCCFQVTKRFGTSFRNCRIGLFAAGHYCPAAFLDERPAIPSVVDFVQLGEIC